MWREGLVEHLDYFLDPQLRRFINRTLEFCPEAAEHFVPVNLSVRNSVEFGFQCRCEIVFDIAPEEIFKKDSDDPATVLRYETAAVEADIIAVLQH